jgi:hypothetical protein
LEFRFYTSSKHGKTMKKRKLRVETLEKRFLLSGLDNTDINLDYKTTASDALAIINHIAKHDNGIAPQPGPYSNLDVNNDGKVTARDALNVINTMAIMNNVERYTVKVYIHPNISTYGLSKEEIRWAISDAFHEYEKASNLDFVQVNSASQARFTITSGELYLGNGVHARGWVKDGIRGRNLQFHNGWVAPGHERSGPGGFWWRAMSSPQALKQIVQHEIGHVNGWGHTSNTSCVMHINASTDDFCSVEINSLIKHYGKSRI